MNFRKSDVAPVLAVINRSCTNDCDTILNKGFALKLQDIISVNTMDRIIDFWHFETCINAIINEAEKQ